MISPKRLFLMIILALGLLSRPVQAAEISSWTEANTKYQSGSFKAAIGSYEGILKSGKETAALDYNLGNTYFRINQKGKALLFYERAIQISPRDRDILWNIDILKTAVADRIDDQNESLILYWLRGAVDRFTINELSLAISGILVLWLLISMLAFAFPLIKPLIKGFGILLFILFIPTAGFFTMKWLDIKDPRVVILDKEVEARYGPSEKETKAFTLHEGSEAKVMDESKDWFYITLPNKNSGWILKKACEIV